MPLSSTNNTNLNTRATLLILYLTVGIKAFLMSYFVVSNLERIESSKYTKIVSAIISILELFILFWFYRISKYKNERVILVMLLGISTFCLFVLLSINHYINDIFYLSINLSAIKKFISFGHLLLMISVKIYILKIVLEIKNQYLAFEFCNLIVALSILFAYVIRVLNGQKDYEIILLICCILLLIIFIFLLISRHTSLYETTGINNIDAGINSKNSNKKNLLRLIFIQIFAFVHFYLVFIYLFKFLIGISKYNSYEISLHSIYLGFFVVIRLLMNLALVLKNVSPVSISKYSSLLYFLVIIAVHFATKLNFTTHNIITSLQILLILFNPYCYSLESIVMNKFSPSKRFRFCIISIYISKILGYVVTIFVSKLL